MARAEEETSSVEAEMMRRTTGPPEVIIRFEEGRAEAADQGTDRPEGWAMV